ncbi:MAG TPA: NYN domain-containing protein, partial [Gemmataceae bacterium]|nr:NYN domain-containing protein [Gemmataceae bacterium]
AYADWSRFASYTTPLHEAAIELIEIPRRGQSGKNSADIRLCVDAMDLAYSKEHIDTFVIVSGDSDFSPLVSKLKELGKHVIGLGMQESTSDLLRDNCDEFIYYEDLGQPPALPQAVSPQLPENKRKAFALLMESLLALRRENKEVLWSSMIKDTMKRKKPSFNEAYHGYRTFSELLEDAQKEGLLELDTDKRSRTYVVTRFGSELKSPAPAPAGKKKSRRRRPAGKKRTAETAPVGNSGEKEAPAAEPAEVPAAEPAAPPAEAGLAPRLVPEPPAPPELTFGPEPLRQSEEPRAAQNPGGLL